VGQDQAERVDPAGGTVRFPNLRPGSHSIRLDDLAPNCSVAGANPRLVNLQPDQTITVPFLVLCPGPGQLLITTVSQGVDLDPDGYRLIMEDSSVREERLAPNDSLLVSSDEFQGTVLTVRLMDVADHCRVESQVTPPRAVASFDPLEVRLVADVIVGVQFTAACLQTGSKIAFQDDASFPTDIYITPAPGGHPLNLTNHPATDLNPALSPNRSRVVFASNRGGPDEFSFDLYAVDADGAGLIRLTNTPGFELAGAQAWSPDGSRIAFAYSDSSGSDIYTMNADGSGVVRLTEDGTIGCAPAWSPDGAWIAFCKEGGIYRMAAAPGSSMLRVVSAGFDPSWSPDGSRIAYSVGEVWDYPPADLAVVGIDGTGFVQLHPNFDNNDIALSPNWSPDGSWIAFTRSRFGSFDVVIVPFLGDHFGEVIRITSGLSPSWR
jgi:TolB protein